jgi:predicted dehydrogenase
MALKVALVGCGKIADGHIEEILKVVAVCDREGLMAEQIAVRYGIPRTYDRYDAMLTEEQPDVVHITTPPQSHRSLALAAIDAGCHVYVEKPLAVGAEDAEALLERAQTARRKLTIGYSYLFDPPALRMRELMAAGVLGEPVHIESFFGYNLSGPFGRALLADSSHWVHHLPGKLFQNNIDHMLYKLVEFMPDEMPAFHAIAGTRRPERYGDARDGMPDELRVMLQGERVSAYATFSCHIRPVGNFLRVYGTRNTLHVDFTCRTVTLDPSPRLPSAIGRLLPAFDQARQYLREGWANLQRFRRYDFHFFAGLGRLIALFYDSIERDQEPPIPYRDIRRVARWMDAIFAQIGKGEVFPGSSRR